MAFPIKVCIVCEEEFELKPDKPGFANRCPEQYSAVIECAAFVNWRRLEMGDPSVLALNFHD